MDRMMQTFLQIQNRFKEKKQWLIKNLIPLGEIAILYAPTNVGKTFLAHKIALEVLTGSNELGESMTGRVFLYSPDTRIEDCKLRINGLLKALNLSQLDEFLKNLYITSSNELDLTQDSYGTMLEEVWEPDQDSYHNGGKWIEKRVPQPFEYYGCEFDFDEPPHNSLIIIDTLSQALGDRSINDDAAIRKAIKNLKNWIAGSFRQASILVIAHTGQNASKGIMGSSLQKNDFPTVLKLRKKKNNQLELYREKIKCKAEGTSIPFVLREIVVEEEETLYVDVGKRLTEFEDKIITLFGSGLKKDEIRDNIYELGIGNTATRKSFNSVFLRHWKNLVGMGYITEGQHDNN